MKSIYNVRSMKCSGKIVYSVYKDKKVIFSGSELSVIQYLKNKVNSMKKLGIIVDIRGNEYIAQEAYSYIY